MRNVNHPEWRKDKYIYWWQFFFSLTCFASCRFVFQPISASLLIYSLNVSRKATISPGFSVVIARYNLSVSHWAYYFLPNKNCIKLFSVFEMLNSFHVSHQHEERFEVRVTKILSKLSLMRKMFHVALRWDAIKLCNDKQIFRFQS